MTYLELINAVLVRLREDTIEASQVDSDPYYRSIGAWVNDAKDRVENAWNWSVLRDSDTIPLLADLANFGVSYNLPDSDDDSYIIRAFFVSRESDPFLTGARRIRQVSEQHMTQLYLDGIDNVPTGTPTDVAVMKTDKATGLITVNVFPRQTDTTDQVLVIDRVAHQPALVLPETRLFVPALPVYTLATALASRERGEVAGTPTAEIFATADMHLSDAIAQDSALYPNELIWYGGMTNAAATNHARGR